MPRPPIKSRKFTGKPALKKASYNKPFFSAAAKQRTASLARARTVNAVMNALGVEKKFLDSSFTGTVSVATDCTGGEADPATLLCLTTPIQDDTPSGREGKKITCKYIEIKGNVSAPAVELQANPRVHNKVFVAVVLDMQTNQAQLNSEDVFKNPVATVDGNASPLRNLLFANRFRILKQEVFDLDMQTLSHFAADSFSEAGKSECFSWYIPLRDLPISFNATATGVIGNVIDNSVHVIAFSTGTGTTTTLAYNARLRFVG